ncbi:MAG: DUF1800 domain-containing protein [Vicinamibacterales bacterium]
MARGHRQIEHLLRRAGFGASLDDLTRFQDLAVTVVTDLLLNPGNDDVDSHIGEAAYVSVTTRGTFSPNTNIEDARQRWLFRMVHSPNPLVEKMALFWHNHFATAYSKVAGFAGALQGTRMMAGKPDDVGGPPGQIELIRRHALGNFRDLLVAVAKDPAMLVWLDGRTNTRQRPQENFAREIMELFTFGIGNYTEQDVYAAARIFTGWNLQTVGSLRTTDGYYEFLYRANQHDPGEKAFTFPIYRDGGRTIPARAGDAGLQDGLDFINALAMHPNTARRLAAKLWSFFISETQPPDPVFVETAAQIYRQNNTEMRPMIRYVLRSPWFIDPSNHFARYSWPVEYVIRSVKEMGWIGYSIDNLRTPLTNMGQTLFEPPDVAGWSTGEAWFSTGAMLSRMNFAASLALNQRFNLARAASPHGESPERLLGYFLDRMSPADFDDEPYAELLDYLRAGESWTGSQAQLNMKASGLARLIAGSAEYQLV